MSNHEQITAELESLSEQLESHRASCLQFSNQRRKRLASVESHLFVNLEKLTEQHSDWEDFHREAEKQTIGVKKERSQLDRDKADLEARMLELEEKSLETDEQRKRIAKKIKEKRNAVRDSTGDVREMESTIENLREDLERQTKDRGDLDTEFATLKEQLESAKEREQEIKQKAAEGVRVANERGKQIKALREQLKEAGTGGGNPEQLEQLQRERDELATKIEALNKQLEERANGGDADAPEELVEEIARLKRTNESLKFELQSNRDSFEDVDLDEISDWEQRKRDLMRQLTAEDGDLDDGQQSKLDSAIRETDRVVAAKDAKISDLQSKLEQLVVIVEQNQKEQANLQADDSMSDDERVMGEQKRLQELQEQWKTKLREAEVEIAVQRAEFARQQSELEEKSRDVAAQLALAKKQVALSGADTDPSSRKKKGWLKR